MEATYTYYITLKPEKQTNGYLSEESKKVSPGYKSRSRSKIRLVDHTRRRPIICHLPQWPMFHQEIIAPGQLIKWPRCML